MKGSIITSYIEELGFKYHISDTWTELQKENFNDLGINNNTLAMILVDENTNIGIVNLMKLDCSLEEYYPNLLNSLEETSKTLVEHSITLAEYNVKQVLVKVAEDNNNILHSFVVINNNLLDFSITIPKNVVNDLELQKNNNYKTIISLLLSIEMIPVEKKVIIKSKAQSMIEEDITYKNIPMPEFYLKYIYLSTDGTTLMTVINNSIYFSGPMNSFRVVKTSDEIANNIKEVIYNNINGLEDNNSDIAESCYMSIKVNNGYYLLNYNQNQDNTVFDQLFNSIVEVFTEEVSNINSFNIYPKKVTNNEYIEEEPIIASILPEVEELPTVVLEEPNEDVEVVPFIPVVQEIDNCPIFKFYIPTNFGEKVDKAFNVFDIIKNGTVNLRTFIFKCSDYDYDALVNSWMGKNIEDTGKELLGYEENTLNDGTSTREFLLANSKYYITIYKERFMIALSSQGTLENIAILKTILETMEIIEIDYNLKEKEDRKQRSIEKLKSQSIDYIDELPPIISKKEIESDKNLGEIASRALCLLIVSNYASDVINLKKRKELNNSKKTFTKLLNKYSLQQCLTPKEKEFMRKANAVEATKFTWQIEGAKALFWTLGLVDKIDYPTIPANVETFIGILLQCQNTNDFISKCYIRNLDEILDAVDLTYRYDWYCVECKEQGISPKLDANIVLERHRAFSWLLTNSNWDNVDLST